MVHSVACWLDCGAMVELVLCFEVVLNSDAQIDFVRQFLNAFKGAFFVRLASYDPALLQFVLLVRVSNVCRIKSRFLFP